METLKFSDVSLNQNSVGINGEFVITFKVKPTEIGILTMDNQYILTESEIPILIKNEYVGE